MKEKLLKFSIAILCIFSFFGYMFKNDIFLLILGAIPLVLIVVQQRNIKIYRKSIIWIICFLVTVISYFYSIYRPSTIYYIVYFGIILFCKLILERNDEWTDFFFNLIIIMCGIHLFFSIINLINTDIIRNINKIFMNEIQLYNFENWNKLGGKIGIHSDPSMMAFIASIAIGISISKLIAQKKQKKWIIYLCIAVLSLLITTKRGTMLAAGVSVSQTSSRN